MKLTKKLKKEIDGMSYELMLRKWWFTPNDALIFQGESGDYFWRIMSEKKEKVDYVRISKDIVGW